MADLITVRSGHNDKRVALWERHPSHPGGEVFIAGPKDVRVAHTPEVQKRLAHGGLVRVDAPDPTSEPDETPDESLFADSLSAIKGIGPATEADLVSIGIRTFAQLAEADAEDLATRLNGSTVNQVAFWIEQAKAIVRAP